jgi:hypothetical protein
VRRVPGYLVRVEPDRGGGAGFDVPADSITQPARSAKENMMVVKRKRKTSKLAMASKRRRAG